MNHRLANGAIDFIDKAGDGLITRNLETNRQEVNAVTNEIFLSIERLT